MSLGFTCQLTGDPSRRTGSVWCRLALGLWAGVFVVGAGCCPDYGPHQVAVSLDPQFARGGEGYPKVEVHLFGVSDDAYQRYSNTSISDWFSGNEEKHRDRVALYNSGMLKVITLDAGQTSFTLPKDDPFWGKWLSNNAHYLFVFTDMPPEHADAPGTQDPRRAILTLNRCERKDITLVVDPSGIQTVGGK